MTNEAALTPEEFVAVVEAILEPKIRRATVERIRAAVVPPPSGATMTDRDAAQLRRLLAILDAEADR